MSLAAGGAAHVTAKHGTTLPGAQLVRRLDELTETAAGGAPVGNVPTKRYAGMTRAVADEARQRAGVARDLASQIQARLELSVSRPQQVGELRAQVRDRVAGAHLAAAEVNQLTWAQIDEASRRRLCRHSQPSRSRS